MSKIAYNACYGGFGLSDVAMKRYAELKGVTLYPKPFEIDGKTFGNVVTYWLVPPSEDRSYSNKTVLHDRDIPRDDPALIQTIEELGDAASGEHGKLRIEEIPAGARYRIDEYDGNEQVMTVDQYDWSVAP